jgi:hypothetical protein
MAQKQKLLESIRNNPKDVRFDDACKVAEWLGFIHKAQNGTSHRAFSKTGEPVILNFQEKNNGLIAPYQARQLIEMLEKYADDEL